METIFDRIKNYIPGEEYSESDLVRFLDQVYYCEEDTSTRPSTNGELEEILEVEIHGVISDDTKWRLI